MTPSKKYILTVGLFVFSLIASACGTSPNPTPTAIQNQPAIDPVFRAFYDYLGGVNRLGPAISEPRTEGVATVQFVRAGKMVFDPTAPATSRFRMAPLGLQMKISEPPAPPPANPSMPYYGGHVIYPDFYPLVQELGLETVGLPLTEVRHNLVRNRWEQFFENLGMYRLDGSADVYLLAYGEWVCTDDCRFNGDGSLNASPERALNTEDDIDFQGSPAVDTLFVEFVNQYGSDFTGFVLDPARIASDGQWEQIFENVVLVTETRFTPGPVNLRPLSDILNITPEAPRVYSGDPNMYFLPTSGAELGYEIPVYFWEYIANHGGLSMFGAPISHLAPLTGSVYHQCFQNLCLAFEPGGVENARIRPEPLGYAYKYLFGNSGAQLVPTAIPTLTIAPTRAPLEPTMVAPGMGGEPATGSPLLVQATDTWPASVAPTDVLAAPSPTAPSPTAPSPTVPPTAVSSIPTVAAVREITIQVLERSKAIGTQTAPEFGAFLWENGRPVAGAALDVTVVMPDGSSRIFFMPLTDANGYATLLLPVVEGPPSTVVPYKVCYTATGDLRVCVYDYFVIWNTP